MDLFSMHSILQ